MEEVCGKECPPAVEAIDGDGSGGSKENEAGIAWREEIERIGRKTGGCRADENGKNKHEGVEDDGISDELSRVHQVRKMEAGAETGPGIGEAAVRAWRLVAADELPAIGAKDRTSLGWLKRHGSVLGSGFVGCFAQKS